jgi:hypothetical protein
MVNDVASAGSGTGRPGNAWHITLWVSKLWAR